jgi:hypothetical protein
MHEHILTGRIAGLVIFRLPPFGTRASLGSSARDAAPSSAALPAMSPGISSLIMAKATRWRSAVLTNLDRQLPLPIHPGSPDFAYAPCTSQKTPGLAA